MGAGKRRKRPNQTTSFFLLLVRLRAYSAKLFAGTKQRFSALNHGRQRGEDVLGCSSPGIEPVVTHPRPQAGSFLSCPSRENSAQATVSRPARSSLRRLVQTLAGKKMDNSDTNIYMILKGRALEAIRQQYCHVGVALNASPFVDWVIWIRRFGG